MLKKLALSVSSLGFGSLSTAEALTEMPKVMELDQSNLSTIKSQARKERQRLRELARRAKRLEKINKAS
jgi:hypothetical protein